ncbi:MAG: hypothetical protein ACI854_001544 [Arenicella sp.]|jgi:hypothetical protein
MPGHPRFILTGDPHKGIVRGYNCIDIVRLECDYIFFLVKLGEAVAKF